MTTSALIDVSTGTSLAFTNIGQRAAQFPMLALVAMCSPNVLTTFIVAQRRVAPVGCGL